MKKAVVLFSGGLDSTTCLAFAKSQGFDCFALTFDYGQRHRAEIETAKKIAANYDVSHRIFEINMNQIGGSALTDHAIEVPDYIGDGNIPVTYVPARNTIFLSIALAWAEVLNANDIFIGSSFVDYSGYPDCRPEYFESFRHIANLATKKGVEEGNINIHAPLLYLSKAETIKLGLSLGIDYHQTVSCYRLTPDGKACGTCDCCTLRKKGFDDLKIADQTIYVSAE